MQSIGAQLSALLRAMPDRSASDLERAAWFDAKADLLERVGSAEAVELAVTARETAARLRGSGVA
ncbi:hypothetical protein [Catenuloplanes atrovinosus]|uniref:Uncharacterized protein n=1 Tax=Catenuloplanes atrovinosus TaxID=137266 RepID=A0AAE3YU54_9ACTN|nr:hypothetical protein [Catenuloplanes atrovinosus]MDR7278687.1 hypothetical protein [Catenuloplanes atrovinosus]